MLLTFALHSFKVSTLIWSKLKFRSSNVHESLHIDVQFSIIFYV